MDSALRECSAVTQSRPAASASDHDVDQVWAWVCEQLRREYGPAQFARWLAPLRLLPEGGGRGRIAAPNAVLADWVRRHYFDRIRRLLAAVDVVVEDVVTADRPPSNGIDDRRPEAGGAAAVVGRYAEEGAREARVQTLSESGLGCRLEPRYRFETFVVGKSNAFAHAAARRVAESPAPPFNPLFLHGAVGLGKTHLMHAVAWAYQENFPGRRVLYVSAEQFMYQFIAAVRYRDTMSFKRQFRSVDLLLLDDVQFIAGKDSTQEEFFHTFNALVEAGKQLVITADRPPTDLKGLEERIVSRLGWGLVADIHPTDYELRYAILQAKAEASEGARVGDDVLDFLARKITSNVRELEGGLNRVVAYADLVGRPVSVELAREVLADLLRANDRKITIDEIQRAVAEYYNLRLSDLLSARRSRDIARPRQVAMYLAKQLTERSLPEIGRRFGGRDHTTVIHAVRKIAELRSHDNALEEDISRLTRRLQG